MTLSDIEERFAPPTVDDASGARAREAVAQSMTLAGRGLVRIRHSPHHLFDVIVLPVVFTVMFSSLFGGAIAGDVGGYLPILVPGVLVQVVLAASVSTGVQLREDMNSGVYDRFASLPIARIAPLAGSLVADAVRYAVAAAVTVVVGLVMGWRPSSPVGVVAACVLVAVVAFAISWIFALLGVMLSTASSVQGVSMMVLMPLTFVSNALVPVPTMPGWMQAFAGVNPVSHLVSAVREMSSGVYSMQIVYSLAGAAIVLAVTVPVTVARYTRRD
ncbi:ABC transporter permease [uncultured Williamsia sp.]|uniref:ABC transporter permease n=1 Tax=uncultured Williamsia sp. TaxID=259311 RepID=UPI0026383B22|nr:ABC transporter permease [uncultured Williamsia sp.]